MRARDYWALTKPRVVALIVFTALVGIFLAVPGLPPLKESVLGLFGIWLAAASAAAINHLIDQRIDAVMQSKDGSGLFAVQGQPSDPAHQRIYTDKAAAAERPLEQSSNAVRQEAQSLQTLQVQDQQEQQRTQSRAAV